MRGSQLEHRHAASTMYVGSEARTPAAGATESTYTSSMCFATQNTSYVVLRHGGHQCTA